MTTSRWITYSVWRCRRMNLREAFLIFGFGGAGAVGSVGSLVRGRVGNAVLELVIFIAAVALFVGPAVSWIYFVKNREPRPHVEADPPWRRR